MAGAQDPAEAGGASSRRTATCGTLWSWKASGASWMLAGVQGPWMKRAGCSCPGETPLPLPSLETWSPTQMNKAQPDFGYTPEWPSQPFQYTQSLGSAGLEPLFLGTLPEATCRRSRELFCSSSTTVGAQGPHANTDHLCVNIYVKCLIPLAGAVNIQMTTCPPSPQLVFNLQSASLTK